MDMDQKSIEYNSNLGTSTDAKPDRKLKTGNCFRYKWGTRLKMGILVLVAVSGSKAGLSTKSYISVLVLDPRT